MFEIGFPELLVIIFVGLLVIGPEKLPQIIKTLTRSFRAIRSYLNETKSEIEKRNTELPVVRDPYSNCYLRQEANGLIVGVYEQNAKAWALDGMDWRFDMELLEPELDRIEDNLVKGMSRIPLFEEVGIKRTICGPITHVPEGNFLAAGGGLVVAARFIILYIHIQVGDDWR